MHFKPGKISTGLHLITLKLTIKLKNIIQSMELEQIFL